MVILPLLLTDKRYNSTGSVKYKILPNSSSSNRLLDTPSPE
jgi:hypothetical protein